MSGNEFSESMLELGASPEGYDVESTSFDSYLLPEDDLNFKKKNQRQPKSEAYLKPILKRLSASTNSVLFTIIVLCYSITSFSSFNTKSPSDPMISFQ